MCRYIFLECINIVHNKSRERLLFKDASNNAFGCIPLCCYLSNINLFVSVNGPARSVQ